MQWWLSYSLWPLSFVIYEIGKHLHDRSLSIWKSWFERFEQYVWEAQFVVFAVFWCGGVNRVDSGAVFKWGNVGGRKVQHATFSLSHTYVYGIHVYMCVWVYILEVGIWYLLSHSSNLHIEVLKSLIEPRTQLALEISFLPSVLLGFFLQVAMSTHFFLGFFLRIQIWSSCLCST